MEPKPTGVMAACPSPESFSAPSTFSVVGGGDCERTPSRWDLEDFVNKAVIVTEITNGSVNDEDVKPGGFQCQRDNGFADADAYFDGVYPDDLYAAWDTMSGFSTSGGLQDNIFLTQNVTPNHSTISATNESQSSICGTVGSPVSANKPNPRDNQAKGGSSDSSQGQSDEDDEAGPCEQSTGPIDKRDRRKLSNRNSARRSRSRKQAHLAELESQAEQLKVENATLYKQLTDADRQFIEAGTDNKVLKADVEALRAKVKLAEDMVARGSLTTVNNQFLQIQSHHLNPPPQLINTTTGLLRMAHVSPSVTVHGNDATYAAMSIGAQNSAFGLGNLDINNNSNFNNGVISDAVSCVTDDIWAP